MDDCVIAGHRTILILDRHGSLTCSVRVGSDRNAVGSSLDPLGLLGGVAGRYPGW